MRKTKKCTHTKVEQHGHHLRIRKCVLTRGHDDPRHHDEHGAWT